MPTQFYTAYFGTPPGSANSFCQVTTLHFGRHQGPSRAAGETRRRCGASSRGGAAAGGRHGPGAGPCGTGAADACEAGGPCEAGGSG